jgi:ankyrin repeat protein
MSNKMAAAQQIVHNNLTKNIQSSHDTLNVAPPIIKTTLMCAQEGDFRSLQRIVTESKATINHCDERGMTALHYAAYFDEKECAEILLGCGGCDVKKINNRGNTALHVASVCGSFRVVPQLLLFDPSLRDVQNEWGETPLHLACATRNIPMINALLDAGASPNIADRWNRTPMQICFEQGGDEAVEVFTGRGFKFIPSVDTGCENFLPSSKQALNEIISEFMTKVKDGEAVERSVNSVEVKTMFKITSPDTQQTASLPQQTSHEHATSSSSPATVTKAVVRTSLSKLVEFPGNPTEIMTHLENPAIDAAGKV